jgi:hypothetical protein
VTRDHPAAHYRPSFKQATSKEPSDAMQLPDEPIEPSRGTVLRSFSPEHLLWQNPYRDHAPDAIAAALVELADRSPEWPYAPLARLAAARLTRRTLPIAAGQLGTRSAVLATVLPKPSDRALVVRLVRLGHWLGLGAAWGISAEADLFWAAAAAIMRGHGRAHPNELPDRPNQDHCAKEPRSGPPTPPLPA